jgi:hypothetical protein
LWCARQHPIDQKERSLHRRIKSLPPPLIRFPLNIMKSNPKTPRHNEVTFHVGMTAWSWGYNMVLKVAPTADNGSDVSVETARSGGKAVSWGSGKKEVGKIFDGIQHNLAKESGT